MHANVKTAKQRLFSLVTVNLTQVLCHDVQLELLQHHIKFLPDQLKGVRENEGKGFCFALILWHPDKVTSQWKWYKMVEVNGAYKHGRYKKKKKNNLIAKFACDDQCESFCYASRAGRTNTTHSIDPCETHLCNSALSFVCQSVKD